MWRFASSPISDLERLCVRDVFSDRPRQSVVSIRWSHNSMVRRLRFRKPRKQTGVALISPTMVLFETRSL